MKRFVALGLLFALFAPLRTFGQADPFTPSVSLVATGAAAELVVAWPVPARHHVYADTVAVIVGGQTLSAWQGDPSHPETDRFTGETRDVYTSAFRRVYSLAGLAATDATAAVVKRLR